MKVSVIIPTYNREEYISDAIDSVLNQTMNDIEIIVIDDGSTDNTSERLEPYKKRIRYYCTENFGPAHARNVGLRNAEGEYIAFLDSDDLYYPRKIELQTNFLDQFLDVAMICTEFSAFDNNGYWDEFHLKEFHSAYKGGNLTYEDIFSDSLTLRQAGFDYKDWAHKKVYIGNIFDTYLQNLVLITPTVMFRRDVLETVGFQDERFWIFEEYEFVLRITKNYKVAFIDVPTYKYRYHDKQISIASEKKQSIHIVVEKQTNLLEIAKKHILDDKDYYLQNQSNHNRRLAVLHKALAIPLMVKGKDNKKARQLLRQCALYDHPEHLLWLTTFAPYIARRVIIKIFRAMNKA